MTAKVVVSLETEAGDRAVDIVRMDDNMYTFRECERSGATSWRKLPQRLPQVYPSYQQAFEAARGSVDWLRA